MNQPPHRSGLQEHLDRGFATLAAYSSRHPLQVLLIALLLLVVGLTGASRVQQDNSMDAFFDESDPAFSHYKAYIQEFSSDEVIYLMYTVPDREYGIFDMAAMKAVDSLTRALERELPFVRKVTSLTNVEFMEADGDDIVIEGMLEQFPSTQEELLDYRRRALSKPMYVNSLISEDGRYGGLVIEMTRTSTDPLDKLRHDPEGGNGLENLYPQVPNAVFREILAREEYQLLRTWITGDVPMNAEYNNVIGADIGVMGLANLLLLMPLSMLFVRVRVIGLLAPIAVVLLSLMLIVGLMGWVGWDIGLFFTMVPPLIIAVGVAQAIHVILAWQQQIDAGETELALQKAIAKVGTPCLLAAVTTSIGFLGMTVSDMRAISSMGWYSAFGVMATFFLSMTLLIALSASFKPKRTIPRDTLGPMERFTAWVAELNLRRRNALLSIGLAVIVFATAGIAQLRVDFNFLTEFRPENPFRLATEKINDTMGGFLSVVFLYDAGREGGVRSPTVLHAIEDAQAVAEAHPIAMDATSVADIIKELNQTFHGDDPAYYRLPESREKLAQLLLVYEISGGTEIDDVLNLDRSKTALQVRLQMVPASQVRDFMNTMQAHLDAHPVPGVTVEISGIGLLWVKMADYISSTQVKSYSMVFILIALVMIIAFGSVKVGMLGMIPNLFPIVFCMGLMGWLGWHLDYLRMLMATIAIGIAVDDTIHMLARLRSEFLRTGRYESAVRGAIHSVGPALIATTVILSIAFLSFLLSQMAVMASFGVLLSTAILVALLGDLFLLPALVLWLKPFGPERSVV